jgi:hypothetical protein
MKARYEIHSIGMPEIVEPAEKSPNSETGPRGRCSPRPKS